MKYKCIIFDCDGVLVDSEMITAVVLLEMANELGISLQLEEVTTKFMGKSFNDIMKYLEQRIDKNLPTHFESQYRSRTFEAFKTDLQPIEGVHKLLEQLEIPYCVASSGPLKKIDLNLTITGLVDHFRGRMFSCYEINSWKPEPDIFLHAAEKMGFEIGECAVIEDSITGVQAAKLGGFDVFMYSKDNAVNPTNIQGAHVFGDMRELYKLLSD